MRKNKFRIVLVIMVLIMSTILSACDIKTGKEIIDQEKFINVVRNTINENYPGVSYGQAFDKFFDTEEWTYYIGYLNGPDEDNDGEPDYSYKDVGVVEFQGYYKLQGQIVHAKIQFVCYKAGEAFNLQYLELDDSPQNVFALVGFMDRIFRNYTGEQGGEALVMK